VIRRVEPVMGTIASIDIRDATAQPAIVDESIAWLHEVDRRFSPYLPDSEISWIADGRLREADAHHDVRAILAIADQLAIDSGRAFDARGWREDGRLDPSGLVKGWAIQVAAARFDAAGIERFAIGAGGDIVVRAGSGDPWRVGIRHPDRPDRVAAVLRIRNGAVATSAVYERGAHIRDPRSNGIAVGPRSVTVVGPSLTFADAYATTAYVMGESGLGWVAERTGYGAYVIDWDDRCRWTTEIDRYLRVSGAILEPAPA
jgi:thiamine biosynthesis lipoprotein